MSVASTTNSELIAAAQTTAMLLAQAFGLGDKVQLAQDWLADDGDTVIEMRLAGDALVAGATASIVLAVSNDAAEQFAADPALLSGGFEAAREHLADTLGIVLSGSAVAASAGEHPTIRFEVLSGGELTALVGLSLPMSAVSAAGARAQQYQPATLAGERSPAGHGPKGSTPLSVLNDVELLVTAELGRTTMHVRDLLDLVPGMVVEIDRSAGAPIDLLVNGRRVAAGEVVVIDDEFGIRITEISSNGERPR